MPELNTKSRLRELFIRRRAELSIQEYNLLSNKLNQILMAWLDENRPACVHTFLPMGREPDIWPVIRQLLEQGTRIVVPVVVSKTELKHSIWEKGAALERGRFNTWQPRKPHWYTGDYQLVILPLLIFDRLGNRVGYGAGYYDRMLQNLACLKMGVSLFKPVDKIEDASSYDVRLDFCATPDTLYRF